MTGRNRRAERTRQGRGFTLIEVLVVLVIIAIMVSLATLSVHVTGKDRELDEESQRIAALFSLLQERAALEARDYGIRLSHSDYEFAYWDTRRQQWRKIADQPELRRRHLPESVYFNLDLESRRVILDETLDRPLKSAGDTADAAPQLVVAASGEGSPFRIELKRAQTDARAILTGDEFGKLQRVSPDQSEKTP
jgi:general secretion pathway protein H